MTGRRRLLDPSAPRRSAPLQAAVTVAVLALTAGLLALTPLPARADQADLQAAVRAGDAKHAGEILSPHPVEQAIADAVKTGKEVPVPSLTDEFSSTVATPEGKLRQDRHLDAQRTKRADGSWTALDDTLVWSGDGSLAPAAASESLVISGGGSGPLATMTTKDGKQLSVGSPFSGALPTPTVSGNSALFTSVAPDTDLKVTATEFGGYTTVLILHTPAAAANPAVRTLSFPTTSKGLELSARADGSLKATTASESVFAAPPPQMWSAGAPTTAAATTGGTTATKGSVVQSAFTEQDGPTGAEPSPSGEPSTADGPGPSATTAGIPVTTSGDAAGKGAIHLSPSPELLDGENTSYPIYVDPSWSNDARGKSHHTWVQSGYPNISSNFDKTGSTGRDRPGVGYQGWEPVTGIERSLYEFNLNGYFSTTAISYANLHVTQSVSADWSCTTTYPVNLYRAGAFDNNTNWNNHANTPLEWVDGKNVPGNGNNANCMGGIGVDFNITAPMRSALADTSKPLAFLLAGNEGTGDKNGFKRFDYDAVLSTLYDHPPLTPSDPKALPTPNRVTGTDTDACYDAPLSDYGWITDTGVRLSSVVSSYNQTQLTQFVSIWDNSVPGAPGVNSGWTGFVPRDTRATYTVPLGTLKDGHYYGWQTQGDDGLLRGAATPVCHFAVDTTPPVAAFGTFTDPVTQFPPSGNGQITNLRLGATGKIPFAAYDPNPSGLLASGLACVRWGYDPQLDLQRSDQVCGIPLSVTELTTKPTHWGTNILYAQVFDEAGNASQTLSYAFYVPWTDGPVAFGDTTGDSRPDILVPDTAGNLITHGRATDPGNASVLPSGTAAAINQAPEPTAGGWKDFHVTHRGSMDPGSSRDDLFVHRDGGDKLYYFANPQSDAGHFVQRTAVELKRPNCQGDAVACPAYRQNELWQNTSQITPIGAPSNVRIPDRDPKNATGFLAVHAHSLWYYPVESGNKLRAPNLVSAGGWDDLDLMIPGNTLAIDVSGTVPIAPALWTRTRVTAGSGQEGDINQYALTTQTRTDELGDYTVVVAVSPTSASLIHTGIKTEDYPTVGADGDQTGDGIPDLWALDKVGNLHVWPATATNGRVTALGTDHYRGNTQAPGKQWPLHESGDAVPGTPNAAETNVAFINDQVDGRPTSVATFNGSTSVMATAAAPVIANPNQSFTLSTWVKSTGAGGVVASQSTAHAASFLLYSEGTGGSWRFALATADNDAWPYVYTSTSNNAALVKTGTWTQLTASFNAVTGEMSLYVNGILAGSANRSTAPSLTTNGSFVLGRYQYQSSLAPTAQNPSFNGSISNFAVYNTAVVPEPTTTAIRHASTADCLDVPNNDTSQGISITGCNNSPAQNFVVNPADATISLRTTMCLELTSGNTANGAAVGLATCAPGTDRQEWLARANGSLYNPASGRCLELPNNDTTPGTRLRILDCNGTPAQTWSIPTLNTPALPVNPWILPAPKP